MMPLARIRPPEPDLLQHRPGAIERAFQLANSGEYATIKAIDERLRQEGYDFIFEHLAGEFTRTQLKSLLSNSLQDIGPVQSKVG
jgi:hypothetical protein